MPTNLKESCRGVHGAPDKPRHDRRRFLKALTIGGSAAGLMLLCPVAGLRAAGQTEALLLSCMDFRLIDDTARYMASRGLTGKYDHIILDVHFISSLPVILRSACKVWVERAPVQIVVAEC
jgi:hypothetical protein